MQNQGIEKRNSIFCRKAHSKVFDCLYVKGTCGSSEHCYGCLRFVAVGSHGTHNRRNAIQRDSFTITICFHSIFHVCSVYVRSFTIGFKSTFYVCIVYVWSYITR